MSPIKTILKSLREFKKETILTLVLIIGEVLLEVIIPYVTGNLVNKIEAGAEMKQVVIIGLMVVLAALISLAFGALAGFTASKASAGLARNIRSDMYTKIQDFSFSNIDRFSSSSLVTRMTTDITNVQNSYMMLIRTAVRAPFMLIMAVIFAFMLNTSMAMTFVVVIPILVVGLSVIAKFAMPTFRKVFKRYDKLNESIEENVKAVRVVKGFSREDYEISKFDKASDDIRKVFTKAERIVAANGPLMNLAMSFNFIFVLLVGARLTIQTHGTTVNVGYITTMMNYGMQVLMSLMMINMIFVMLTLSVESMKRISEVLIETPDITNPENPVMEVKDGSIEFTDVSFKYSKKASKYALSDIDLKIDSGMTVGILGGTGSSKSTLIQLISRLYDVSEGSVKVGGIDVREYDLKVLRDAVAVVLQKNELFSGSIKDNLRWGNPEATDEQMKEACRLAQAEEFIEQMPDKYDTHIEQGGTNVSGGQKQRLCIARALLKKPRVLILDDSTSAVDMKTDAIIRKGFKEFIPDTTKIIIAQRIASVEDSDLIIVMDDGVIAAKGTHDELMVNSSIYREIYENQTKGGKE